MRVCARACNEHPRALQALVLVNIRGFAGFGSAVPGRPCKNEVQRGTERVAEKGDEVQGGEEWWFPLETEMESCARGDYARERNKERDKDGDLRKEGKDREMKKSKGVGKRGRVIVERGGNARMEKEIFCGAHGSP